MSGVPPLQRDPGVWVLPPKSTQACRCAPPLQETQGALPKGTQASGCLPKEHPSMQGCPPSKTPRVPPPKGAQGTPPSPQILQHLLQHQRIDLILGVPRNKKKRGEGCGIRVIPAAPKGARGGGAPLPEQPGARDRVRGGGGAGGAANIYRKAGGSYRRKERTRRPPPKRGPPPAPPNCRPPPKG